MGLTAYYTDPARSASLQATLTRKFTKSNVRNSLITDHTTLQTVCFVPEADISHYCLDGQNQRATTQVFHYACMMLTILKQFL